MSSSLGSSATADEASSQRATSPRHEQEATTPPVLPRQLSAAAAPDEQLESPSLPHQRRPQEDWTEQITNQFEDRIGKPSREAVHSFFYPTRRPSSSTHDPLSSASGASQHEDTPVTPVTPEAAPAANSSRHSQTPSTDSNHHHQQFDQHFSQQADQDRKFVHHFWTTYDDILILSLFTQLGIVFRLASATWFEVFDNVFSQDSALFVNLPLNCLACFFMGLLCSGERLMEIISTRFSPPALQQDLHDNTRQQQQQRHSSHHSSSSNTNEDGLYRTTSAAGVGSPDNSTGSGHFSSPMMMTMNDDDDDHNEYMTDPVLHGTTSTLMTMHNRHWGSPALSSHRRRRRRKTQTRFHHWEPPVHLNEELRDVQLLALERRIRASKCLLLFPVKKQDVDVMEHYFQEGYKRREEEHDEHDDDDDGIELSAVDAGENGQLSFDLELRESLDHEERQTPPTNHHRRRSDPLRGALPPAGENTSDHSSTPEDETNEPSVNVDQIITDVTANVTENISRLRRVNIADGWDAGTTAEEMSDDLMLGLRDGFCGALSSFSSWVSSMVHLMRDGNIGRAFVGLMLGLQLPIIAYRFGQHVAVYIFVWRCRFESHRDERRGYGIRVAMNEYSEREAALEAAAAAENGESPVGNRPFGRKEEGEIPSVRAIVTALFIMAVVTQCTSLSFFADPEHQQIALSLLFSPLGVLARWRLSKYNSWRPTFPLGTFTANILACALSGSLGTLLAGNPGDRERIALVSVVAGFGGTMSSLAAFVVEVLAGIDPILFRFDGAIYAILSVFWAMVTSFVFSASVAWADATSSQ